MQGCVVATRASVDPRQYCKKLETHQQLRVFQNEYETNLYVCGIHFEVGSCVCGDETDLVFPGALRHYGCFVGVGHVGSVKFGPNFGRVENVVGCSHFRIGGLVPPMLLKV